MGEDLVTFRIGEDPPPRLDKALARDVPEAAALSRSRLARLIAEGAVRVAGRVETEATARVAAGDVVEIVVAAAAESHLEAQEIALVVVWEDDELIVIDKPAGMVVHPGPGNADGTLVNALIHHCGPTLAGVGGQKRPGIVHRIDKETSGLLVAAKTDRAHQGLSEQFAAHTVERHYMALCHGVPDKGDPRLRGVAGVSFEAGGILRIDANLDRHRADRQKQAVTRHGGRHAVTRVRVEEAFGAPPACALVDCWLETGRTHQIRVHLAHAGHGLIGDPVYGGKRRLSEKALGAAAAAAGNAFPRQALHAATLGFVHPVTGEDLRFESPLPHDMADLVEKLRAGT
jgi:23S rRNA pseudouridine1911/1915/1917 synthase